MAWNGVFNMVWNGVFNMAWNGVLNIGIFKIAWIGMDWHEVVYMCICYGMDWHGLVFPLQKELNLYVDKNGTVWDLLQEAANEVCLFKCPCLFQHPCLLTYIYIVYIIIMRTYSIFLCWQITFSEDSTEMLRYAKVHSHWECTLKSKQFPALHNAVLGTEMKRFTLLCYANYYNRIHFVWHRCIVLPSSLSTSGYILSANVI